MRSRSSGAGVSVLDEHHHADGGPDGGGSRHHVHGVVHGGVRFACLDPPVRGTPGLVRAQLEQACLDRLDHVVDVVDLRPEDRDHAGVARIGLVEDRARVVVLMAAQHGLDVEDRTAQASIAEARHVALRIPQHELRIRAPGLRPRIAWRAPRRMRRVSYMAERMQPGGGERHHREERSVHHGHADAVELRRRCDQRHFRKLALDRGADAAPGAVDIGIGAVEDGAGDAPLARQGEPDRVIDRRRHGRSRRTAFRRRLP